MLIYIRPLFAFLCLAGWSASFVARAATDGRPTAPVAESALQTPKSDEARFEVSFTKALAALKGKRLEEARLLFETAAQSADLAKNPMSWQAAEFNACHALCLQGRKAEAEALAKQIATLCESTLGTDDPLTSDALAHLAFVLKQNGHLADAEPVYRRNVQMLEAKYGQEHVRVAKAISKHAALLQTLGKLGEAESLQRKALAIVQKIGHDDHPDFCFFLTNLASCLQASQKTDEAGQLMERAFDIVRTTTDSELTSAGSILRKQAEYYRDLHQLDRAEDLGHRALLRLAKRPDINRARFYYYDLVADVYRSILQAQGLGGAEIDGRLRRIEDEAASARTTTASAEP